MARKIPLAAVIIAIALGVASPASANHDCGASAPVHLPPWNVPPCENVLFVGAPQSPPPDCSQPFAPPLWMCYAKPSPQAEPNPLTFGLVGRGNLRMRDLGDQVQISARPGTVVHMWMLLWDE